MCEMRKTNPPRGKPPLPEAGPAVAIRMPSLSRFDVGQDVLIVSLARVRVAAAEELVGDRVAGEEAVVAVLTVQDVGPFVALEAVVGAAAVEDVGGGAAVEAIGFGLAEEEVAAAVAGEAVAVVAAVEPVAAAAAVHRV